MLILFRINILSALIFVFNVTDCELFPLLTWCKVVGCASGVGLLPAALSPSFLDKGVRTGLATTQVRPTCAQTRPSLSETCLWQAKLFQASCGRKT